jgi:hypothetical protein
MPMDDIGEVFEASSNVWKGCPLCASYIGPLTSVTRTISPQLSTTCYSIVTSCWCMWASRQVGATTAQRGTRPLLFSGNDGSRRAATGTKVGTRLQRRDVTRRSLLARKLLLRPRFGELSAVRCNT